MTDTLDRIVLDTLAGSDEWATGADVLSEVTGAADDELEAAVLRLVDRKHAIASWSRLDESAPFALTAVHLTDQGRAAVATA